MMNKKSWFLGELLLSAALIFSTGSTVSADTTGTANTTGSTDVSATFTKSTSPVTPVNPDNPNKPDNSGDKGNGAKAGGDLSLIYISNKLDFGSHEIDVLNSETYTAAESNSDMSGLWNNKAIVEVSDVRGTNAGWTLSVVGGALTGTDGNIIKGATLSIPTGNVTNSGSESNGVQASSVTNTLDSNSATVLSAAKDKGAGVTVEQIDPSAIKLMIPANTAKAQTYSTTLNWNLSDTPAS